MKTKLFLLAAILFCWSASAYDIPAKTIASHTFQLSLKPKDSESQDARAADLYITRFPESGWIYEGECTKLPGSTEAKFSKVVQVQSDGEYYFISRGGDAAGMAVPPHKNDTPQVKVVVDTVKPKVRFVAPAEGTILKAGEEVRLDWVADDRNLALTPIDIYYTDGKSGEWQLIAQKQPNTGHFQWQIPLAEYSNMKFKVIASDIAGNTGEGISEGAYKVMLPDRVAEKHTPALPVEVELTPVSPSLLDNQIKVKAMPANYEVKLAADNYVEKDPRPATAYPELDANDAKWQAPRK